ncbi:MAG: hypothetical protein RLZ04_788 [Actinomycetota bacterium]
MREICDDLAEEHRSLSGMLDAIGDDGFATPTPAEGWTVHDQVAHLWYFDQRAAWSLTEPERFSADLSRLMASGGIDEAVAIGRSMEVSVLRESWRLGARAMVEMAQDVDPSSRVPWYGPAMSARSSMSARLMEAWAHGQDIADAVGVEREPSMRLRHVVRLAVRARPYAYRVNKRELPAIGVSVILDAPDGSTWEWIEEGSDSTIRGSALDFCLLSVQRRHLDDTSLVAEGPAAHDWLSIAQAFAGPPGSGRSPRGR